MTGRLINVPFLCGGVARFTFEQLCISPLGAADYLALADQFHTIVLTDVPLLTVDARNALRRLIVLLDILYEKQVRLICTADAPPVDLFRLNRGEPQQPSSVGAAPIVTPTAQLYPTQSTNASSTNTSTSFSSSSPVHPVSSPASSSSSASSASSSHSAQSIEATVLAKGGSSGRPHTVIGGQTEWSATGLSGASMVDLDPRFLQDEVFAFERAVSRLSEMASELYLQRWQQQRWKK
jgi:predicted ATPase